MANERVTNFSLQKQISDFGARLNQVADGVAEIKRMLQDIEKRVRNLEQSDAGSHPLMQSRIDSAWRKIDEHENDIKTLKAAIARLETSNRLLAWLGGILGSTVIIWLVTQILGQVAR